MPNYVHEVCGPDPASAECGARSAEREGAASPRPRVSFNMPLTIRCEHAIVTGIAILALAGCGDGGKSTSSKQNPAGSASSQTAPSPADPKRNENSANSTKAAGGGESKAAANRPLLDGWEKPALAIVVSGEQHGYFEPCGCTEMQLGGMTRRADLFRQLRERGWEVTGLDVGGVPFRQRRQSLLKYEAMLESMRLMSYRATALGPEELSLGLDNLLSLHQVDPDNPDASLSFLAANVVLFDIPDLGTPLPFRMIRAGDVTLGVTAILGADFNGSGLLDQNSADLTIKNPDDVLPGVIEKLKEQKPDFLVLLSQASPEESRELAKKYPDFDLILTAGGPEDPNGVPEKVGDTLILSAGRKGKFAGVVGYYPDRKGSERFRFQLVELSRDQFKDMQQVVEQMRTYQQRIKEEKLAGNHPDNIAIEHPTGATFVGTEKCGECHAKALAKWKTTPHSHAYENLEHARKGAPDYGITRVYDAECLACHVTGWDPQNVYRYTSGFINEEFAEDDAQKEMGRLLKGVGCENCHGPGSRHIELVEADNLDEACKLMRVLKESAKQDLCVQCHDSENSPNFDFDIYWPKIEHPGLD